MDLTVVIYWTRPFLSIGLFSTIHMRRSRKFCQESNCDNVFFSWWGVGEFKIPLWADHHRPASETLMAFRWRADDGLTLNAGLVALWFFRGSGPILQRVPIFLYFFRGGGPDSLPPPPLDPHMIHNLYSKWNYQTVKILKSAMLKWANGYRCVIKEALFIEVLIYMTKRYQHCTNSWVFFVVNASNIQGSPCH